MSRVVGVHPERTAIVPTSRLRASEATGTSWAATSGSSFGSQRGERLDARRASRGDVSGCQGNRNETYRHRTEYHDIVCTGHRQEALDQLHTISWYSVRCR